LRLPFGPFRYDSGTPSHPFRATFFFPPLRIPDNFLRPDSDPHTPPSFMDRGPSEVIRFRPLFFSFLPRGSSFIIFSCPFPKCDQRLFSATHRLDISLKKTSTPPFPLPTVSRVFNVWSIKVCFFSLLFILLIDSVTNAQEGKIFRPPFGLFFADRCFPEFPFFFG